MLPTVWAVLRRIAMAALTFFLLITVAFFIIRAAPGGPFDSERERPAAVKEKLEERYGWNKPLYEQYGDYMLRLASGDLGRSVGKDRPVTALLIEAGPKSLTLGVLALLVAIPIGCGLGILAAFRQNGWLDYSAMAMAMIGISLPTFVVGPILVSLFGIGSGSVAHWFPPALWGWDFEHLFLPVITLSLPMIAYLARIMRGSMIEALRSPFVRTARAKGLSSSIIIRRHLFKPAALPVVSFLGPAIAGVLTGSVVVEKIFALPGLGQFFLSSATGRDLDLAGGLVIVYGGFVIVANMLVDLAYLWLDPKARLKAS